MRKPNSKVAAAGVGVLAIAGLAGAAFAASITTPPSNAGQGTDVVDGFTVTNVEYDSANLDGSDTENASVTEVEFDIARDTQTAVVEDANASVFVQLRDGTDRSDWVECTTTAGHSVCDTSAIDDSILMVDVDGISVVAYDDLD
jgi:hypothetical protein